MITDAIIAPIELRTLKITDVHFKLFEKPLENTKLNLGIKYKTSGPEDDGTGGAYALRAFLKLSASLASSEDKTDVRLESGADVFAEVAIDSSYFETADAARDYLAKNALSMSYAHSRSVLMTIAGMTPAGDFTLPPIIPDAIKLQE